MTLDIFWQIGVSIILCLAQPLVLNHIHLFDCATPLLYVYMVLLFPRNYPKWGILLWSFIMGVVIDTFSNTPGVAAASMTLIGAIQPYYMEAFVPRDAVDDFRLSVATVGFVKYSLYSFVLVLIYCTVFFTLETFSFFNWLQWLESVLGSTAITFILIITIDSVRRK